jgi:glycerol kinase
MHLKVFYANFQLTHFLFPGSGSIGGNVIRFLRDNLGFINDPSEVEALAGSIEVTLPLVKL